MYAQITFPRSLISGFDRVFYTFMERLIEITDHIRPFFQSLGNFVELFFNGRSKMKVDDLFKILYQEIIHHRTNIGWEKLPAFGSCIFCFFFFGYVLTL